MRSVMSCDVLITVAFEAIAKSWRYAEGQKAEAHTEAQGTQRGKDKLLPTALVLFSAFLCVLCASV